MSDVDSGFLAQQRGAAADLPLPRSLLIERQTTGNILYQHAVAAGVDFRFGLRVTDIDEEKPSVRLEDGSEVSADLIVGADGANSTTRQKIMKGVNREDTDMVAHYLLISKEKMLSDPDLAVLFEDENMNFWMGPKTYVICASLPSYCACAVMVGSLDTTMMSGRWEEGGDAELVRDRTQMFNATVRKLVQSADIAGSWRIIELPHLDSWTSKSGKVLLVGDAAHAMGPHVGQVSNHYRQHRCR